MRRQRKRRRRFRNGKRHPCLPSTKFCLNSQIVVEEITARKSIVSMRKPIFLIFSAFSFTNLLSQPAQPLPSYLISNVALPAELDKQVCISGMKYFNGSLCLAS